MVGLLLGGAVIIGAASCTGEPETAGVEAASAGDEHIPDSPAASSDLVDALYVEPSSFDFSENPELLERILESPHAYFRFINIRFSQAVCERWVAEWSDSASIALTTRLNLHGDAHLEQYAVTELGRGLTDFDDSSTGPAALDALRFGVSLILTSRANGWDDHTEEMFAAFLAGYRDALENRDVEAPEPALARRTAEGFSSDPPGYFEYVESVMEAISDEERGVLESAMLPYADRLRMDDPSLPTAYFDPVSLGRLRLGVGSALDRKYLVRINGRSNAPDDDEVLEIKEVRSLAGIDCIEATENDPFRILLSQARIAYRPFNLLGYLRLDEKNFWVHAWVRNYYEVDMATSFESPEELAEVVYDVGFQLGRGHHMTIAAPFGTQLKQAQLEFLDRRAEDIQRVSLDLAAAVVLAWERFGAAVRADGQASNSQATDS